MFSKIVIALFSLRCKDNVAGSSFQFRFCVGVWEGRYSTTDCSTWRNPSTCCSTTADDPQPPSRSYSFRAVQNLIGWVKTALEINNVKGLIKGGWRNKVVQRDNRRVRPPILNLKRRSKPRDKTAPVSLFFFYKYNVKTAINLWNDNKCTLLLLICYWEVLFLLHWPDLVLTCFRIIHRTKKKASK